MNVIFVTGIGTDIGKTIVSSIIVKALNAAYWKPIQCGSLDYKDSDLVSELTGCEIIPENYLFSTPASPYQASITENKKIDKILLPDFNSDYLVIEGAGGLYVPITKNYFMIDLISDLGVPAILVSRNYVGAINHTLLSLETLENRKIKDVSLIFSGGDNDYNQTYLSEIKEIDCLANIPDFEIINKEKITEYADNFREKIVSWITKK